MTKTAAAETAPADPNVRTLIVPVEHNGKTVDVIRLRRPKGKDIKFFNKKRDALIAKSREENSGMAEGDVELILSYEMIVLLADVDLSVEAMDEADAEDIAYLSKRIESFLAPLQASGGASSQTSLTS